MHAPNGTSQSLLPNAEQVVLFQAPGGGRRFTQAHFQGASRQRQGRWGSRSPAGPLPQLGPLGGAAVARSHGRASACASACQRWARAARPPPPPAEVSPYLYLPQAAGSGGRRRRPNPTALPFQGGAGRAVLTCSPENAASPARRLPLAAPRGTIAP